MVVSKTGEVIQTDEETVTFDKFLKTLSAFDSVRVGVLGGAPPFDMFYFAADKKEIKSTILGNQCLVTYSIMYNSKMDSKLQDTLYISKLKQTII